jgi:HD superfamily phosphodiesterase
MIISLLHDCGDLSQSLAEDLHHVVRPQINGDHREAEVVQIHIRLYEPEIERRSAKPLCKYLQLI